MNTCNKCKFSKWSGDVHCTSPTFANYHRVNLVTGSTEWAVAGYVRSREGEDCPGFKTATWKNLFKKWF